MTATAPLPAGARPGMPTGAPVGARRLFAAHSPSLADHLAALGPVPPLDPATVVAVAADAGIDGRGGAGFPLARKLAAVPRGGRRPALAIGNGAEGEPASRKDATLLAAAPHLVLDGLVLAARAVGAPDAVVATTAERAVPVRRALAERRDDVAIRVTVIEHGGFVSGEASALVSALAGGPPTPRDRVVRLAERGPDGRPTLLSNVETFAQLALAARFGPAWFRSVGTPSAPGTRLVTVSDVSGVLLPTRLEPAVLEVAGGTRLGDVLAAGGVDPARVRAVLVGGWGGTWVPASALDVPFDPAALAPYGAAPGAGVLAVLPAGVCPVAVTAQIAGRLATASAGRCGPCVNGLPRIADTVGALAATVSRGPDPSLPAEIARIATLVDGRGSCHHPDGVARMVRSALAVFADDVAAHQRGACTAGGAR